MCKILVAIVRDVTLFRQPESTHLGDCPICCLPFSLNLAKSALPTCCSKVICNGCHYANLIREREESLEETRSEARVMCCASCGIAELDDIKLMDCDDCDLVRYCSDECKEDHRSQHETMCKERAAELRDEILIKQSASTNNVECFRDAILFRQPESSHMGDCPICFLPLSIDSKKSTVNSCCSKTICAGCSYANKLHQRKARLDRTCPFCRKLLPETQKEGNANAMIRVKGNDPVAMRHIGMMHYNDGNYEGAIEYWTKAAELGDVDAHYKLSVLYEEGKAVEKDEKKERYHLEEAAIAGHPTARYNLGCDEWKKGRIKRAVKHLIIAANLGHDGSIQALKEGYKDGKVGKEEFATALRAHQAAADATKSPQREAAAKFFAFREDKKK
eukprot:scaffold17957_cov75-Skeletonema_dohrnii-CCMP3373.AAC.1